METRDRRGQLSLDTDILVVGGGAAGVAAALTAARAGARVLLLEKYGFTGDHLSWQEPPFTQSGVCGSTGEPISAARSVSRDEAYLASFIAKV